MSNFNTVNITSSGIVATLFVGIGLLTLVLLRASHSHDDPATALGQSIERVESLDIRGLCHMLYWNGKTPDITPAFESFLRSQLLPQSICPDSLNDRQFILITPPTVKGDVYRLRKQRILLQPYGTVPRSTLDQMGLEMRAFEACTVWHFAAKVFCQWLFEGGATSSFVQKAGVPSFVLQSTLTQAKKSKVPLVLVVLPGSEAWVATQKPTGLEIWDLGRMLQELSEG